MAVYTTKIPFTTDIDGMVFRAGDKVTDPAGTVRTVLSIYEHRTEAGWLKAVSVQLERLAFEMPHSFSQITNPGPVVRQPKDLEVAFA